MNYNEKALFLDRDGVINIDNGYVHKYEDVEYLDHIFDLITKYKREGFLIIVVTNQAGISKGYYTEDAVKKLHRKIDSEIIKKTGFSIDKWYYCVDKASSSSCRKPNPGMILNAIEKLNLTPRNCMLIGDKLSDIIAGNKAEISNCFLLKGKYHHTDPKKIDIKYKFIESLESLI